MVVLVNRCLLLSLLLLAVTLSVSCGGGGSGTIVESNQLPILGSMNNVSINEDEEYVAKVAASDGDGDVLVITVNGPSWVSFNSATNIISGTPENGDVGSHNITISANDGKGTVTITISVTVNNINDIPSTADDEFILTSVSQIVFNVLINDLDIDGDNLTITSVTSTTKSSIDIVDNKLSYTPNSLFAGSDKVTYTVSDGNGGENTGDVVITFGNVLFGITIENNSLNSKINLPVTFGQPFIKGDISETKSLKVIDKTASAIPLQLDVKSRWEDGTYKHAIISLIVPSLAANKNIELIFILEDTPPLIDSILTVEQFKKLNVNTSIEINDGSSIYKANVMENIDNVKTKVWLEGPIVTEWIIPSDLIDSIDVPHSYLTSYFHVKYYNTDDIRVSVILENTHSFYEDISEGGSFSNIPRNVIYNWSVKRDNTEIEAEIALEHFAHSRWRKVYSSFGATPGVLNIEDSNLNIKLDKNYLIKSRAVANYDINGLPEEPLLAKIDSELSASDTEPMGLGMIDPVFSSGIEGSIDAAWSVAYLLSGDQRARRAMIANADAAASIGIHFRDERISSPNNRTGEVLSILDHPLATIRDDSNYIPFFDGDKYFDGKSGTFKDITPDTAHQNSFAYLPYLLTGEYYFLEELHFWANFNLLNLNAGSGARNGDEGLIVPNQIRGQAWAMRTLANSAFITPNNHINKEYFNAILNNNIEWYVNAYTGTDAPHKNDLGLATYGYNENTAISYQNFTGYQTWMDNWLTAVIGRIFNMGYLDIEPFLKYKVKVPIALLTDLDTCYIFSSTYAYFFRDGKDQPLYDWKTAYEKTIKHEFDQNGESQDIIEATCGSKEMADLINNTGVFGTNYIAGQILYTPNVAASYFSRLQGAVAAAVDSGEPGAQSAWGVLMGSSVLPDYNVYFKQESFANGNKYNIVPLD